MMSDTAFIRRVDEMLKEHYGDDFEWDAVSITNFNKEGVGQVRIESSRANNVPIPSFLLEAFNEQL